jgi:hypothetical protein
MRKEPGTLLLRIVCAAIVLNFIYVVLLSPIPPS